jgi:hypothetical protein
MKNDLPKGFAIFMLTILVAGSGIGFTAWLTLKLVGDHLIR